MAAPAEYSGRDDPRWSEALTAAKQPLLATVSPQALSRLDAFGPDELDLASITTVALAPLTRGAALRELNASLQSVERDHVLLQADPATLTLYPARLLADGSGVELRESNMLRFRAVPSEAVKRRADDIARCESQLQELKTEQSLNQIMQEELTDQIAAGQSIVKEKLADYVVDQRRIKREIEALEKRLAELKASPLQQGDAALVWHEYALSRPLPWGVSRIQDRLYRLERVHELGDAVEQLHLADVEAERQEAAQTTPGGETNQ